MEPCGATVVSVQDEVVAGKWDSGGQSVTTVEFLAMLACGHETEPVLAIASALLLVYGMPQMPEAFVGGHKAFNAATPVVVGVDWAPRQHDFQKVQQALGDLQVGGVTSVMEGDQHFV